MSHTSKLFTSQKVDIPNRSGFDMSFENCLTMKVGTITPVLCEEVLPNETYDLGFLSQVQLPPLATDFYGRVDLRLEAFFVPNRIIWGGWQDFMTMPVNNPFSGNVVRSSRVPYCEFSGTSSSFHSYLRPGTLADYLGIKCDMPNSSTTVKACIPNLLPFFAYHKIYDDWYRNSKLQVPVFKKVSGTLGQSEIAKSLPYISTPAISWNNLATITLNDGTNLFTLRQRNFAKDYYTTAALYPQASGDVAGSTVTADENGTFSIGALRAANTLQRWLDRNNVAGERYADQIKATFGCYPSDSTTDRAIFLGSEVVGIYNKSVMTTAESDGIDNMNPFVGSAGAKVANAQAVADGTLIDSFKTTEHGYIMVLATIVPHASYSTGTRRQLLHSEIGDFANPLLQGLGEQAIYKFELTDTLPTTIDSKGDIFGYQQQYSEYKYHDDEVHGLLRDGENLQSFALQRSFDTNVALNTSFISIPSNYMDQVTSVNATMSHYGAWANFYFAFRKVSPLSEYVIPTLGDLKNTHTEEVPYRGTML